MMLAGIRVREKHGIELARLLRRSGYWDTSEKLLDAYNGGTKVLGLTIAEREQILRVLDDPPDFLSELRGVLLDEHEGRVRDGLVYAADDVEELLANWNDPLTGLPLVGESPRFRTQREREYMDWVLSKGGARTRATVHAKLDERLRRESSENR